MSFPAVGQNTKLGKGAIHYQLIADNGDLDPAIIFAGNCAEMPLNWQLEEDTELQYTGGPAVPIDTVVKSAQINSTPQLREFKIENLARFHLASSASADQSIDASVTGTIASAVLDRYYDLGVRHGTGLVVNVGSVVMTAGDDYAYDSESGFLWIKAGGAIAAADAVEWSIAQPALSITRLALGQKPIQYVRLYYQSDDANPSGVSAKDRYVFWKARMAPGGDLGLISDSRAVMPMNITIYSDAANHPSEPYGYMDRVTA